MINPKILIFLFLFSFTVKAQIPTNQFHSKSFSKSNAMNNGKRFLFQNVLGGANEKSVQFEIDAISSSNSSDITTLIYDCKSKKADGMLICFFSDYITLDGVGYFGYNFKNFDKPNAYNFLNKIKTEIETNKKYIKSNDLINNIFFKIEDIDVLIYYNGANGYVIRLLWKNFDSSWDEGSFNETFKAFEKKLNK